MYDFKSRVRYSEIGEDEHMTLDAVINYFQDCSTFHSEDIGLGIQYLAAHRQIWVLSSWQIVIKRYPKLGEHITIGTWPYDFKGFNGSRNFVLFDEKQKMAAYANSLWIFMSTETGRPIRLTQEIEEGYQLETKLEMDYASRKISLPGSFQELPEFPVRKYQIDTNLHVNNGQYVRMAAECIPKDFTIRQMRAEYKNKPYWETLFVQGFIRRKINIRWN